MPRSRRPDAAVPTWAAADGVMRPLDHHLFAEGRHLRLHEQLGALRLPDGRWRFSVWAPRARAVEVIGDWNGWWGAGAELQPVGETGVWTAVLEGPELGQLYKFHILRAAAAGDRWLDRADPFALCQEAAPGTASRLTHFAPRWGDEAWIRTRGARMADDAPVSLYEVHLGSWRRGEGGRLLSYRDLAPLLVAHVQALGFTHVELMPLAEHPYYGSWGYHGTGYFAPTSRHGSPEDLAALIDALHQASIGVVMDWVPSHFATDEHALGRFDGEPLFEHPDPRRGFHPDWGSFIFDYGRPEVMSFLLSSAHAWVERFHIDALRVDGVASMLYLDYSRKPGEWLPAEDGGRTHAQAVELLRRLTGTLHEHHPGVRIIAEESTAWPHVTGEHPDGLGFDWKWDLGWMHDTLAYLGQDPLFRKHHHERVTFRGMYAWSERFLLPLSHDEVVHGKRPLLLKMAGPDANRFAHLRILYASMYAQPGKKLLFMGSELAPLGEWSHEQELPWELLERPEHAGIARLVARLNTLLREEPALHQRDHDPEGFRWSVVEEKDFSVFAWLRIAQGSRRSVLAVFNCTPVARPAYPVGVTQRGKWRLLLDTAAAEYGGPGSRLPPSLRTKVARDGPDGPLPHVLRLDLPPLAALYLVHEGR